MHNLSGRAFLFSETNSISVSELSAVQNPAPADIPMDTKKGISTYTGPWGETQIMHLLRRCLFGISASDYRRFSNLDLSQCLEILLQSPPAPDPPVNAYNSTKFDAAEVPLGKTWINAPEGTDESGINSIRDAQLKAWWLGLMINQGSSVVEKMTLFWSSNLATQSSQVKDARYDYRYCALLRSFALGNFKTLIKEITVDPAMLKYLNGEDSTAAAPNENYARELQELFTIGKGPGSQFTQGDVESAARILTGWTDGTSVAPTTVFNPANHDSGDKQFSKFYNNAVIKGRSGPDGAKETDELIDLIFQQRETAKNLCRKLYRWFVHYEIDAGVETGIIDPLAGVLIENHFEVKPVMKALLASEHFFDAAHIGCQIKNPVDFLVGACRQFNVTFPPPADLKSLYLTWDLLVNKLKIIGMMPDEPPGVAGWPAYYQQPVYQALWINSNTVPLRNSFTDMMVSHAGIALNPGTTIRFDILSFTAQLLNPEKPDSLIHNSIAFLCAVDFDSIEKGFLKTILLSGQKDDSYWTDAWNLYSQDPDDEVNKSVVLNRLTQYYTYLLQRAEYQLM